MQWLLSCVRSCSATELDALKARRSWNQIQTMLLCDMIIVYQRCMYSSQGCQDLVYWQQSWHSPLRGTSSRLAPIRRHLLCLPLAKRLVSFCLLSQGQPIFQPRKVVGSQEILQEVPLMQTSQQSCHVTAPSCYLAAAHHAGSHTYRLLDAQSQPSQPWGWHCCLVNLPLGPDPACLLTMAHCLSLVFLVQLGHILLQGQALPGMTPAHPLSKRTGPG